MAMEDCKNRLTLLLNEIRIEASIHVVVGRVKHNHHRHSGGGGRKSGGDGASSGEGLNVPPPMLDTNTLNTLMNYERLYFVGGHCDVETFTRKVMSNTEKGLFFDKKRPCGFTRFVSLENIRIVSQ